MKMVLSPSTLLRELGSRFDRQALRPPRTAATDEGLVRHRADTRDALQQWCWRGAGPGNTAWWQPGACPAVAERLAVGVLQGPDRVFTAAWADHFARQLDGSLQLQSLPGRAAGLGLRLRVKLQDAMWWRQRQSGDPWDAGWALCTPAATQHLRIGFGPRRATLVLAEIERLDLLAPCLTALWQRHPTLRHPVRWLWVGTGDRLPALSGRPDLPGLPVARFLLD